MAGWLGWRMGSEVVELVFFNGSEEGIKLLVDGVDFGSDNISYPTVTKESNKWMSVSEIF